MDRQSNDQIANDLLFEYDKYAWCITLGFQMGRLEFLYKNTSFDATTNELVAKESNAIFTNIVSMLGSRNIPIENDYENYQEIYHHIMVSLEILGSRYFSCYMIGIAALRITMINVKSDPYTQQMFTDLAKSCIYSIPSSVVKDKDGLFDELLRRRFDKTIEITDFLQSISSHETRKDSEYNVNSQNALSALHGIIRPAPPIPIRILFLASNPRTTDRIRVDQEVRTIQDRLRGAEFRDRFDLVQAWAVQHSDVSGLLLRYKPHIVHFAGHGSQEGQIILEDRNGEAKPVSPDTLTSLFRTLRDNIQCIVLNACYSDLQAKAIIKVIDCVVGMSSAIGDEAAIQFASGFYQALGYGRSIRTAFELGCSEINLADLSEEAKPKLRCRSGVDATRVIFIPPQS
jgi:AcrR family transcriptional regulator